MEKKKPSNSHQASFYSLCDTTAQQQQQQNGSTQTPKTKTIFATTKFPELPQDSEIMTFFLFFLGGPLTYLSEK
jgi:hypothetical protein